MPKFEHGKPELPLYMEPGIVISNYELGKDNIESHYQTEVIDISSFEQIN